MKKILRHFVSLFVLLPAAHVAQGAMVDVCGTDTLILSVSNYQYGTIQWQESWNLNNWVNIPNAQETTYKFFPTETKYYRAMVGYSDCSPEYSDTSLVQLPPVADGGADRVVPGNFVSLTANIENAAVGTWSIISGNNGSLSDINDPKAQLQGSDTLYVLVYSLSNACGTSKDTIEVRFRQNTYVTQIVVVDTTDLLLSDTTQTGQGEYKIYFSSPIPTITNSTILVGIINDGFLRQVTSFIVLADTFTMQTTQATLEDIIIDGSINVAQTFAVDTTVGKTSYGPQRLSQMPTRHELNTDPKFQTGAVYYYDWGEKVNYKHDGITLNKKMAGAGSSLIDINFNSTLFSTGDATLQLNGYYRFEPNIVADMDFKGLTLKTASIGMYNGIIERNYQLSLTATAASNLLDQSFTLLSISKPIIFVIGAVPVYIDSKLALKGKVSVNISEGMNIVHDYTKTSTHNANMEYVNQQWAFNYNETSQVDMGNSISESGNLTQNFEIGPELTFKIYGIVGPYVEAKMTEDLNLCANLPTSWTGNINIGGNLTVGAKAEVAGWSIFDVSKTWGQDFYSAQFPYNITIESGNQQDYTGGNALQDEVKVKVAANTGLSVPGALVHFNPQDGGSVASGTVAANNIGIAGTIWTPGGSLESRLEVSIVDCNGNEINNSPVVFYAYDGTNCVQSSLSVSIFQSGTTISPLAHNGIPPYTYSTDGINFSSVVPEITPTGLTYTFTVKDNNGCIASESYNGSTVVDIDGNTYLTIQIGSQEWMQQNLRTTKYANGDPIPNVTDNTQWENLTTGAWCHYNNDSQYETPYGKLYNWYTVDDSRNVCPTGWHVPTDEEWKQLEMFLGMSPAEADASGWRGTDEGGKLREAGTTHWDSPNTGATNSSGFTGLPGGYRNANGPFNNIGNGGNWWSSTEYDTGSAWGRVLSIYNGGVYRGNYSKDYGFSVRCVRD